MAAEKEMFAKANMALTSPVVMADGFMYAEVWGHLSEGPARLINHRVRMQFTPEMARKAASQLLKAADAIEKADTEGVLLRKQ